MRLNLIWKIPQGNVAISHLCLSVEWSHHCMITVCSRIDIWAMPDSVQQGMLVGHFRWMMAFLLELVQKSCKERESHGKHTLVVILYLTSIICIDMISQLSCPLWPCFAVWKHVSVVVLKSALFSLNSHCYLLLVTQAVCFISPFASASLFHCS